MSLMELIERRYSCRKYEAKPVEREKLMACIEAARLAPSACNSQPWRFILVDDPALVPEAGAYMKMENINGFAVQAQAFIVILPDRSNPTSNRGGVFAGHDFTSFDIGIAAAHITLAATEQGLGSCIMGLFQTEKLRELLGIPESEEIALIVALGYPEAAELRPKKRKTTQEVVSFNRF